MVQKPIAIGREEPYFIFFNWDYMKRSSRYFASKLWLVYAIRSNVNVFNSLAYAIWAYGYDGCAPSDI